MFKKLNILDEKDKRLHQVAKDVTFPLSDKDKQNMINNDFNIQDKDLLPQMNPNMNFSGDGQPFSSFLLAFKPVFLSVSCDLASRFTRSVSDL